jgi:hypothetical protein
MPDHAGSSANTGGVSMPTTVADLPASLNHAVGERIVNLCPWRKERDVAGSFPGRSISTPAHYKQPASG